VRMDRKIAVVIFSLLLLLSGCAKSSSSNDTSLASAKSSPPQNTQNSGPDDLKLKTLTKLKIGSAALSTQDILDVFVGKDKGIFKKYNIDVDIQGVDGGVVAVRGLQSGTFDVIFGLPENVISGVSQGADMKIIGASCAESLFEVYVSPNINKVEDLKGKAAAVLQPNNGTDMQMRWWLKKHGLEPDKDVTIISAGANPARLAALKSGQVAVTVFTPPTDVEAEKAGFKRLAAIKDELKGINHDVIAASGKMIREKPEVLKAFMAAMVESIKYMKDPKNLDEVVQIGVKDLGFDADVTRKGLEFVMPTIPDDAKFNKEGIQFSIDLAKQVNTVEKDLTIDKVVDESFFVK
jgi:NitT/TauT family transport system substrate-binding protein